MEHKREERRELLHVVLGQVGPQPYGPVGVDMFTKPVATGLFSKRWV
jgi:hypothetical protein